MASSSQIRKIHTLKNVLCLDDDLYREMLMSFDVQSSKDLTYTEAIIFTEILEDKVIITTSEPSKVSLVKYSSNLKGLI